MKRVIFKKLILHPIKNLIARYGTWRLLTWFSRTQFLSQPKVTSVQSML